MRKSLSAAAIVLAFGASGCAPVQDHVLFVTNTSLGFDADSATGSVDLGYNRQEGVAGPSFNGGELPPVYAYFESDGGLFSRNIDQRYATGDAARIISGGTAKDENELSEKNCVKEEEGQGCKIFFVGTRTNYGLHIGISGSALTSVSLAFKRQELSFIPIAKKDGQDTYIYPSALASFNSTAGQDVRVGQLIATGDAAEVLANQEGFQQNVIKQAEEAFSVVLKAGIDENSERISNATDDSACFDQVKAFIAKQIPDETPEYRSVTTAAKYADLRQEIVSDEGLRGYCNQFAEN